mgnify:CR=1 FL=1
MKMLIISLLGFLAVATASPSSESNGLNRTVEKNVFYEKFKGMTLQERQQEFQKIRDYPSQKFNKIAERKIRQKIYSMTPENRQRMHDNLQRHRTSVASEMPENLHEKFSKFSDEDKQKIRNAFNSLTLEQREEIRKQGSNQFPSLSGPVPAGLQKIRKSPKDRVVKENWRNQQQNSNDRREPRL